VSPSSTSASVPTATLQVLLRLAWPVVLARSAQAVIGFTDAAMVAPLGEDALAAATTGSMNAFTLFILPMGIVFIVQSFSSQLFGAGDPGGARRYAWYGLVVAALTHGIAVLVAPWTGAALAPFDYAPAVHAGMSEYLSLRLLAAGAVVGIEAIGNWYGGLGNTRLPMLVNLLAMVLNVALNWVLIHGNLGAPHMGVAGAALASAIATWAAFALALGLFVRNVAAPAVRERARLRRRELVRLVRFGLPNGINWFLEFAAFAFFVNVVVSDLGTTALAAMMTVVQVNSVSFMPAFGLASAGAILVGQAIGAHRKHEVPGIVRRTAMVAATWQGLIGLVYFALPGPLMSLFASEQVPSEALVRVGAAMLAASAAWQLFDALAMTLSEALRSAGDTAWCLWARVVIAWVLFVPASIVVVGRLDGGPVGAIGCVVFYLAALAAALLVRFRSGAWRRIDLTGSGSTG
jgi:MATE family multidrug resistance protein